MSMKNKKRTKIVCLSLVAALSCSILAGCKLVSTDTDADMKQVIAQVDISQGDDFKEGGEYAEYAETITSVDIIKRELINGFLSYGYQYVQQGQTYSATFQAIKDSLVARNTLLQYAMVQMFESPDNTKNKEDYNQLMSQEYDSELDKQIAGVKYFLDEDEILRAEYTLKRTINTTLDSQEQTIIQAEHGTHMESVRTLPTGVDTQDEDFYDVSYQIYTGKNLLANCGTYEAVEGSTPATRKRAYNVFIAGLIANDLVEEGENVSKLEDLKYYQEQTLVAYQDALMQKQTEMFEAQAEATVTEDYAITKYLSTLEDQKESFANAISDFDTALSEVSDTSFLLAAPALGYGFAINILLPFSDTQNNLYTAYSNGHNEGENFVYRASLLKNLKATDQRESWFNGEVDYAYEKTAGSGEWYFFENNTKQVASGEIKQYETLKNYAGSYPFNGTATKRAETEHDEYRYEVKANEITIDDFIQIFEGQMNNAEGLSASGSYVYGQDAYYSFTADDYYKTNASGAKEIDYSKFLYYVGQVDLGGENSADVVFDATSLTNKAMSIVNELSFAYNTDTAGLNTYLGYSVSAFKTNFVPEYEYAAKVAVAGGVGTYTIAPSTYGWHIMYTTFVYGDAGEAVYNFEWAQKDIEGTFSNLYYEALISTTVSDYTTTMQTRITQNYSKCVTVYEDRYQDLLSMD